MKRIVLPKQVMKRAYDTYKGNAKFMGDSILSYKEWLFKFVTSENLYEFYKQEYEKRRDRKESYGSKRFNDW